MSTTRPHDNVIAFLEHHRQMALSRADHPSVDPQDALAERQAAAEFGAAIDWLKLAPRWSPATPTTAATGTAEQITTLPEAIQPRHTTSASPRPKLTLIRGDHP